MSDKSWPTWLPIRPSLKQVSAYGAPQLPVEIKLNTNENPFGLSDDLIDKILTQIKVKTATLNRYPDRDAVDLRKKLAKFINKLSGTKFNESNIWAANGSNEIIQSIFLAFGGNGALGFEPSYSVHKIIANTTQTTWKNVSRNKDFSLNLSEIVAEINRSKPSITFLTTPNNPTGTSSTLEEIQQIAQTMKSVNGLLVIDEEQRFGVNQKEKIKSLKTLVDVGLGFVRLGQSATTLSGGEAQRVKLATELQRRSTGRTIYVLDEPTTGLHFEDVRKLLLVLERLVDSGNTVIVIEHNLDVIKNSDWVIDMGPEGGFRGGTVVAQGTPEQIAKINNSYTGKYLAPMLKKTAKKVG